MRQEIPLATCSLLVAVCVAYLGIVSEKSHGLPDLLLDVALGGHLKLNTVNGPMLLTVGHHMKCPQCRAFSQKGLSQLAECPCKVDVSGTKDGQYYSGVITVTRTDKEQAQGASSEGEGVSVGGSAAGPASEEGDRGCQTKPMHLRVTAKGTFIGGLQVFAGDARTEAMLQQLLKFFGPNPKNGLVLDGILTCRQEWDLEHPDYLIPKPGYPSDVAVKIPYGSTLMPLDEDKQLSPFETEVPESLAQKYGASPTTRRLRAGLLSAMQSPLFRRDAAANARARGVPPPGARGRRGGGSVRSVLRRLAEQVSSLEQKTDGLDRTLGKVDRVASWGGGH